MYNNPYYYDTLYDPYNVYNNYGQHLCPYWGNPTPYPDCNDYFIKLKDYGPNPFATNIEKATKQNNNFRTALWTGEHLQLTLMSINVGEDIGLEVHPDADQFIRIEQGEGIVIMGDCKCNLNFQKKLCDDYIAIIPAGKWHNVINIGNVPLKLYSIYAPPEHPHGTIHKTKEDAKMVHRSYTVAARYL